MYQSTWTVIKTINLSKEDFDYALSLKKLYPWYGYNALACRIIEESTEYYIDDIPDMVIFDVAKEIEKYCENHLTEEN